MLTSRSDSKARKEIVLTLIDQGTYSLTSFATAITIGRFCSKEDYGLFSLGMIGILFVLDIQGALLSTPYTMHASQTGAPRLKEQTGSLLVHQTLLMALIVTVLSLVYVFAQGQLFPVAHKPLLEAIIWVSAPLLMRDQIRRVCLARSRTGTLIAVDVLAGVLQLTGLFWLIQENRLSIPAIYLVIGVANGMAILFWIYVSRGEFRISPSRIWPDLKSYLNMGKWIFGSGLIWGAGLYLYPWLLTVYHGAAAAGVWAACNGTVGLIGPLCQGIQNYATPVLARSYSSGGIERLRAAAARTSVYFGVPVGVYALILSTFGEDVVKGLYGPQYSGYGLIIGLLAWSQLFVSLSFGYSRSMFTLGEANKDFYINLLNPFIMVLIGVPATIEYGPLGSAIGLVLANLFSLLLRMLLFRNISRARAPVSMPRETKTLKDKFVETEPVANPTGFAGVKGPRQTAEVPWLTTGLLILLFIAITLSPDSFEYSLLDKIDIEMNEILDSVEEGNIYRRVGLVGLVLVGLALTFSGRKVSRLALRGPFAWCLVFFIVWCLASVLWSSDFDLSIRRTISLGIFWLTAIGIATHYGLAATPYLILGVSATLIALGFANEVLTHTFFPFDSEYRFGGIMHPNVQAVNCAVLMISAATLGLAEPRYRVMFGLIGGLALVALILTKSRTTFGSMLLSWFLLAMACRWRGRQRIKALTIIGIAVSLATMGLMLIDPEVFSAIMAKMNLGREGSDAESLNGRLEIWGICLDYILKNPVLGYSFNGFWDPKHIYEASRHFGWGLASAHSFYIEIALEIGLIGAFVFVLLMSWGLLLSLRAWNITRKPEYFFHAALSIFYLLHGVLESQLADLSFKSFALYVGLAALAFRRDRKDFRQAGALP